MLKNKILSDELRDVTPCSNLCAFRCGAIINPGLQKASTNQRGVEGGDGAAFNCTLTLAVCAFWVELLSWNSGRVRHWAWCQQCAGTKPIAFRSCAQSSSGRRAKKSHRYFNLIARVQKLCRSPFSMCRPVCSWRRDYFCVMPLEKSIASGVGDPAWEDTR